MIRRIIEISSGPARLSVANRQLVIDRAENGEARVPCEDVGVLLVDHPAVTYTRGVFRTLLGTGAAVVLCGRDYHPSGLLLPVSGNTVQAERYRCQIEAPKPLKKRLWQAVIKAKLRQQATVLTHFNGKDAGLSAMAGRVRSGDPENLEARAAQRYWPQLFGPQFRRLRTGPPPNNLLNYGYTVLRAAMARALCAAGLLATHGIHHHNRYNAFCLADDMMEPYRPFVDLKVRNLVDAGYGDTDIDRPAKAHLLGLFNDGVEIAGMRTPLLLALHATASSLNTAFAQGEPALALPTGLPLTDGSDDDDSPGKS